MERAIDRTNWRPSGTERHQGLHPSSLGQAYGLGTVGGVVVRDEAQMARWGHEQVMQHFRRHLNEATQAGFAGASILESLELQLLLGYSPASTQEPETGCPGRACWYAP